MKIKLISKFLLGLGMLSLLHADGGLQDACVGSETYDVEKNTFSRKVLTLKSIKKNGELVENFEPINIENRSASYVILEPLKKMMIDQEVVKANVGIVKFTLFSYGLNQNGFSFVKK